MQGVARDSVPGPLSPGSTLGRYQILRRIAVGGMAELYLARQTGAAGYEKIVALKRVLPHLTEDVAFVRMFLNEAKLAAGLSHSNIVHVIDFGSEGGEQFMAMEYIHGRSVQQVLRGGAKHGGVPLDVALTIVHEVAAALHYAHDRAGPDGAPLGLVHRDVSPSNILVSFDGDVKLVDFGIAKATAHTRVTRSGAIKGKLAYMAPEQVRGEAVDRRADVFALAVVAYELCTGRRCFTAPGEFALINRVAEGRYESPTSADPDFPPDLAALIVRGLSVDPDDRFETARAMQRAVEAFASGHGHRISRMILSEYLDVVFGREAYPTTQTLPAMQPRSTETTPPTRMLGSPRSRRASAAVVGGALALGLLVGLGGPALLGDEETATGAGRPRPLEVIGAAQEPAPAPQPEGQPETSIPAQPVPTELAEGGTGGQPSTASGTEGARSTPAALEDPVQGKNKKRRARPRKRPRNKRRGKDVQAADVGKRPEYLPPSAGRR